MSQLRKFRLACVGVAIAMVLLGTSTGSVSAQSKGKPDAPVTVPESAQVIPGHPMTISVLDNTQISIEFTNSLIGQFTAQQFYSDYADAVYLWASHDSLSPPQVFGPATMPGGHTVTAYVSVSNTLTGSGTPEDPWVVTTVNDVPGTKLRFTQHTTYINGAEYVKLHFHLEQMGGTEAVPVTLFHAADTNTFMPDRLGYGYYNMETGAIGDYILHPTGRTAYQQFVPDDPVNAYQESTYEDLWNRIGDAFAPGPGFDNTIMASELHDTAIGLQWNLIVPEAGDIAVGDTAFFGPHEYLKGSFVDVASEDYCYDFAYNMGIQGIASGYSDGTFRPSNYTTRGQVSKMMVLAAGWPIDTSGGPHFTDVPVGSTFYDYVETAFKHHVFNGYDDGTFKPGDNLTRSQAMKILVRTMEWPIDTFGGPHFTDVPVGSTFYDYIETAYRHNVIRGYNDGTFRPGDYTTRGQLSKILDLSGLLR
jgi:hypothetical protein